MVPACRGGERVRVARACRGGACVYGCTLSNVCLWKKCVLSYFSMRDAKTSRRECLVDEMPLSDESVTRDGGGWGGGG